MTSSARRPRSRRRAGRPGTRGGWLCVHAASLGADEDGEDKENADPSPRHRSPRPSARLGRRGRREESIRVYRDFVESWFVVRCTAGRSRRPYERFSERLDRVGPGLIRPSPSLLRLARWPSSAGEVSSPAAEEGDDEDDGGDSSDGSSTSRFSRWGARRRRTPPPPPAPSTAREKPRGRSPTTGRAGGTWTSSSPGLSSTRPTRPPRPIRRKYRPWKASTASSRRRRDSPSGRASTRPTVRGRSRSRTSGRSTGRTACTSPCPRRGEGRGEPRAAPPRLPPGDLRGGGSRKPSRCHRIGR